MGGRISSPSLPISFCGFLYVQKKTILEALFISLSLIPISYADDDDGPAGIKGGVIYDHPNKPIHVFSYFETHALSVLFLFVFYQKWVHGLSILPASTFTNTVSDGFFIFIYFININNAHLLTEHGWSIADRII